MSMGMATGGRRRRRLPMSEINMTPFVDVVLVILTIFMVTAPVMMESINVSLPKAKGGKGSGSSSAPFTILLDAEGNAYIEGKKLAAADIDSQLPALLKGHEKETLTLKADKTLPLDKVAKVLGAVRAAGITGISIAVEGGKK